MSEESEWINVKDEQGVSPSKYLCIHAPEAI
jgi:hypothetical protein